MGNGMGEPGQPLARPFFAACLSADSTAVGPDLGQVAVGPQGAGNLLSAARRTVSALEVPRRTRAIADKDIVVVDFATAVPRTIPPDELVSLDVSAVTDRQGVGRGWSGARPRRTRLTTRLGCLAPQVGGRHRRRGPSRNFGARGHAIVRLRWLLDLAARPGPFAALAGSGVSRLLVNPTVRQGGNRRLPLVGLRRGNQQNDQRRGQLPALLPQRPDQLPQPRGGLAVRLGPGQDADLGQLLVHRVERGHDGGQHRPPGRPLCRQVRRKPKCS